MPKRPQYLPDGTADWSGPFDKRLKAMQGKGFPEETERAIAVFERMETAWAIARDVSRADNPDAALVVEAFRALDRPGHKL